MLSKYFGHGVGCRKNVLSLPYSLCTLTSCFIYYIRLHIFSVLIIYIFYRKFVIRRKVKQIYIFHNKLKCDY